MRLVSYAPAKSTCLQWLLLLLILQQTLSSTTPSKKLDLSYKHYLDASTLKEAIRCADRQDSLDVDISSSILGDENGFQAIVQALLPAERSPDDESDATVGISLTTRGNRLTPKLVDGLFQKLLSSANQTNPSNTNQTLQSVSSESNNNNNKTDSQGNSSSATQEQNASAPITNSAPPTLQRRPWNLHTLDVGWNHLQLDAPGWKGFLKNLQKLLQSPGVCPQKLCFNRCGLSPAACRAIGKGIINRYTKAAKPESTTTEQTTIKPLSLHLCGNPDLGDSGAAAIAAAIRTVVTSEDKDKKPLVLLDTLDLSACEIGDAGAEAIALALESCPTGMCIRHLDLSHNQLTDVGAAAIGHALILAASSSSGAGPAIETLDLSGNAGIKDKSTIVLAEAVEKGAIANIRLRSCHIFADGAAAFGKAMLKRASQQQPTTTTLGIDLSGNPLGVLRGKMKKGNKYSASAIKSKATATTAAYVSMFQRGIKSGLKEFGVELGGGGGSNSGESDDEEEEKSGMSDESVGELDPAKARCGIKAFANAILDNDDDADAGKEPQSTATSGLKCELGLRRCFLDHGAADALAAVLVHAKDEMDIDLAIDVALNPVLEEEMTEAIQGDEAQEDTLRDMSDRYLDALEALREARERAKEAARAAAARLRAEKEYESQWDVPDDFPGDPWEEDWAGEDDSWVEEDDEASVWDSDADYEQQYDADEYW